MTASAASAVIGSCLARSHCHSLTLRLRVWLRLRSRRQRQADWPYFARAATAAFSFSDICYHYQQHFSSHAAVSQSVSDMLPLACPTHMLPHMLLLPSDTPPRVMTTPRLYLHSEPKLVALSCTPIAADGVVVVVAAKEVIDQIQMQVAQAGTQIHIPNNG